MVDPGERILSCSSAFVPGARRRTAGHRPDREGSGTSMTCPHGSGLLAAFLSARREFIGRPDEVKWILVGN